ncbi:tRNA (uridine(54)-C5)-methyltransferase TrmA [Campylobacter sp. LR291e]|uniref:tRNA (uridine(54)-C5)-methyltransferase TrmA n=1 Tax=Campylobacter sp. LR291e TaxID=2593546 RepID=UPI00123C2B00|nr:tRNA (uridine(54)-C5)-methyltransferase TrmA [Campylobacter sp. LR291e]KAA6230330.1 tRNA (uridine(54)-C5)-methyltransferase TrmA [Campylobacter sp. LR291e]
MNDKIAFFKDFFKDDFKGEFEIFNSPLKHFRTRAEFAFFHDNNKLFYAMFDKDTKKKIIVEKVEFVDKKIYDLMPILLTYINENENLKQRLFGVEFLATRQDISTTLLYHKDIFLIKNDLEKLSKDLNLKLITRSKNKKLIFKQESLSQKLIINKKPIFYTFDNDCFVQPNTYINEKMIEYILSKIILQDRKDLLELYCGYGNFSIALSVFFENIMATEISKKNIEYALKNCALNNILNIDFVRLSSEELVSALKKEREFFRLKNVDLNKFKFSHILLDPPRVGLSFEVMNLAKMYNFIIYISCNPYTLKENLKFLTQYHEILYFAFFDQFVNTPHLESIVILRKIP